MKVNGKEKKLESAVTLNDYLLSEKYNPNHIVIELDGEIIRKENYPSTILNDNSILEIVQFMGGG